MFKKLNRATKRRNERRLNPTLDPLTPAHQKAIKDLRAVASGNLRGLEPRRMTEEELVRAAWGYLRVEEKDLTLEEAKTALACTS